MFDSEKEWATGSRNRFKIRKTKKVCRQQGKVQLRRWQQAEREKLILS